MSCPPVSLVSPNASLSDADLVARSDMFGSQARVAQRRFLATVPEIETRNLLGRRFASSTDYAAQVGGASPGQVLRARRLRKRLAEHPRIWNLFESGLVGASLLERVPKAALAEDPEGWLERLQTLPKRAIEKLLAQRRDAGEDQSLATLEAAGKPSRRPGKRAAAARALLALFPRRDRDRLEVLRDERSRLCDRRLSATEVLQMLVREAFMETRQPGVTGGTPAEVEVLIQQAVQVAATAPSRASLPRAVARAVRARARRVCEVFGCDRAGEALHHRIRVQGRRDQLPEGVRDLPRHDPRVVHLLCSTCHTLLHEGLFERGDEEPARWRLRREPTGDGVTPEEDVAFRRKRLAARRRGGRGRRGGAGVGWSAHPGELPGQTQEAYAEPETLPGQTRKAPAEPKGLPGQTRKAPAEPEGLPGQTRKAPAEPETLPGQNREGWLPPEAIPDPSLGPDPAGPPRPGGPPLS